MNSILWAVQVVLVIKIYSVAVNHGLRQNLSIMQDAMAEFGPGSRTMLHLSAVLSFLAAAGLILPAVFNVPGEIVPLTASALVVLLITSLVFHLRTRENPKVFVSLILIALSIFVAYGRWQMAPL